MSGKQKKRKSAGSRFSSGFDRKPNGLFSFESPALLLTDLLIVALLLVFPFIMGGREAIGHRIVISLALMLGAVWSFHRFQTGGRLILLSVEPLLAAALLLVWFQSVPNTPEILRQMSGEYERLLPEWGLTQIATPGTATPGTGSPGTGSPLAAAAGTVAVTDAAMQSSEARPAGSVEGSPESATVSGTAVGPVWNTVSLAPAETKHGILMLVAYLLIAVVVAQRIQSEEDCARILKLTAISGVSMAAFAILQLATSNDRFFWFYRHPYTGTREILKGAFTNRNHFAQFLALSLGPLTWWMIQERRDYTDHEASPARRGLGPAQGSHSQFGTLINIKLLMLMCATATVMLSVLLSLSRGGMMAAGTAFLVALACLWKLASIRSSLTVLIMGLGFAVIGGLFVVGQDKVEARVEQLASADADKIDEANGRRTIWKADIKAVKAFPILGTGVGSHRDVYPIYMTELGDFASHEFTHAESSYLQLALETGFVGVGLLVLGLVMVLGRLIFAIARKGDMRRGEILAAVLASLAAGVLHAAADFIWYVPAIVVTTIILGVMGLRAAAGFQEFRGITIPRVGWMAACAGCCMLLLSVQPALARRVSGERYYHQYVIATFDERQNVGSVTNDEIADSETDSIETAAAGEDFAGAAGTLTNVTAGQDEVGDYRLSGDEEFQDNLKSGQRRMQLLIRSLRANPGQHRVQLQLASLSLNLFDMLQRASENPYDLAQISDTVASSGFTNVAEMHKFLNKAFGKSIRLPMLADKLARQSLRSCPVQGTAYLTLAETAFLRDPKLAGQTPFVAQALLVRGHDPRVRFFAGQRALMAGDHQEALKQWRAVFHSNSGFRRLITRVLARAMPVSTLMTQFQPNALELRDVMNVYVEMERNHDLPQIVSAVADAVAKESSALSAEVQVAALMQTYEVARKLKLDDRAEAILKQAMACDEAAYWPRRHYGMMLFESKRYQEASEILLWCYQQQPGDLQLDRLIRESRRRSLRQETPVMQTGFRQGETPTPKM